MTSPYTSVSASPMSGLNSPSWGLSASPQSSPEYSAGNSPTECDAPHQLPVFVNHLIPKPVLPAIESEDFADLDFEFAIPNCEDRIQTLQCKILKCQQRVKRTTYNREVALGKINRDYAPKLASLPADAKTFKVALLFQKFHQKLKCSDEFRGDYRKHNFELHALKDSLAFELEKREKYYAHYARIHSPEAALALRHQFTTPTPQKLCKKLTVDILKTFNDINDDYYRKKKERADKKES
jgi:hypothetical protein